MFFLKCSCTQDFIDVLLQVPRENCENVRLAWTVCA